MKDLEENVNNRLLQPAVINYLLLFWLMQVIMQHLDEHLISDLTL
jgi:hypothetical protein